MDSPYDWQYVGAHSHRHVGEAHSFAPSEALLWIRPWPMYFSPFFFFVGRVDALNTCCLLGTPSKLLPASSNQEALLVGWW